MPQVQVMCRNAMWITIPTLTDFFISRQHQNYFYQICSFFFSPTSFLKRKSSRQLISTQSNDGRVSLWRPNLVSSSMVPPNPLLSVICDSIIHEGLSWGSTVCKLLINLHKGIGLMRVCKGLCLCACTLVFVIKYKAEKNVIDSKMSGEKGWLYKWAAWVLLFHKL